MVAILGLLNVGLCIGCHEICCCVYLIAFVFVYTGLYCRLFCVVRSCSLFWVFVGVCFVLFLLGCWFLVWVFAFECLLVGLFIMVAD